MAFQNILFEIEDGVARITLNRPDKLNSFTVAMHLELREALAAIRADASVRVLVLTGAGRGFCAGQDLADLSSEPGAPTSDLGHLIGEYYGPLVLALRGLPFPVVCAVNGVAAGAGANLALACDIVLAARSASFVEVFCKLGLLPDTGGTYFLPRMIGSARAMGLSMLGDKLSAERAENWGLIWKCVDDGDLAQETDALARHFAAAPTKGLAYMKKALHISGEHTLAQQLDLERDLMSELGNSDDYHEGVKAFLEKRAPAFTGK